MSNIWLYADEGVALDALPLWERDLQHYWGARTLRVRAEDIRRGIDADVLLMGGGADLPYCARLQGEGIAAIRDFVRGGGRYLGVCAGAYFACATVDFRGENSLIYGARALKFFPGCARGSLPEMAGGRLYDGEASSRQALCLPEFPQRPLIYHGGCRFLGQPQRILAHYPGRFWPAIIAGDWGAGRYLLSGIHFEGCGAEALLTAVAQELRL